MHDLEALRDRLEDDVRALEGGAEVGLERHRAAEGGVQPLEYPSARATAAWRARSRRRSRRTSPSVCPRARAQRPCRAPSCPCRSPPPARTPPRSDLLSLGGDLTRRQTRSGVSGRLVIGTRRRAAGQALPRPPRARPAAALRAERTWPSAFSTCAGHLVGKVARRSGRRTRAGVRRQHAALEEDLLEQRRPDPPRWRLVLALDEAGADGSAHVGAGRRPPHAHQACRRSTSTSAAATQTPRRPGLLIGARARGARRRARPAFSPAKPKWRRIRATVVRVGRRRCPPAGRAGPRPRASRRGRRPW